MEKYCSLLQEIMWTRTHTFDTLLWQLHHECILKFHPLVVFSVFPAANGRRGVPEEASLSVSVIAQNVRWWPMPRQVASLRMVHWIFERLPVIIAFYFLPRLSRSRSQKIYRSGLQMSARWVYVIKIQMYAILARGRKNDPDLWCPAAFALIANYKNSS